MYVLKVLRVLRTAKYLTFHIERAFERVNSPNLCGHWLAWHRGNQNRTFAYDE